MLSTKFWVMRAVMWVWEAGLDSIGVDGWSSLGIEHSLALCDCYALIMLTPPKPRPPTPGE